MSVRICLLIMPIFCACTSGSGTSASSGPNVSNVSLKANEFTLTGSGLNSITGIIFDQDSVQSGLDIASATSSTLVARLTSSRTVHPGHSATMTLSQAETQATVSLTVELSDAVATNFTSTGITDTAPSTVLTLTPGGNVEVSGSLKVGGSETGAAATDIKSYIQKSLCEARRGVWVDNTGCTEYAVLGTACTFASCNCGAGLHICTISDMWLGGFQSLMRPGYVGTTNFWIGGMGAIHPDKLVFPVSGGTAVQCDAGAYFLTALNRAGASVWYCIAGTNVYPVACCRDGQ